MPSTGTPSGRSGLVVGGDTVGGNYYGTADGTGFSRTCDDADGDGVCDEPYRIAENNTDFHPLAEPNVEDSPNFDVTGLRAPRSVTPGGSVTITATIRNTGDVRGTRTVDYRLDCDRDGTPEPVGLNRTVTLAPDETRTVWFDVPTADVEPGTYAHGVFVGTQSVTDDLTVEAPGGETGAEYYQVDFVAGEPIENPSTDRLYAGEDRLLRFAFGETSAGITDRGSAWPSDSVRDCVDYGHVEERGNATASVSFTVADGCGSATLSLAVYSMPGETFDVDTVDRQVLLNATTGTYEPGGHTITVGLPDGTGSDRDGVDDRSAPVRAR